MVSIGDQRLWTSCGLFADFLRTKRGPLRTHDNEQRYRGRADTLRRYRLGVVATRAAGPTRSASAPAHRPGRAGPGSATRSANVCGHARARAGTPAPARPRERACRPRPNGLRPRPRRARTRAARESSQSRWRHEVEHHVNTGPRTKTRRIDPHRVAARLATPFGWK